MSFLAPPLINRLVYSGAMDIVLAILPWKIIWALTMNRKEKVGVMVAMSMGVLYAVLSP